jgi:hypothetical protein
MATEWYDGNGWAHAATLAGRHGRPTILDEGPLLITVPTVEAVRRLAREGWHASEIESQREMIRMRSPQGERPC